MANSQSTIRKLRADTGFMGFQEACKPGVLSFGPAGGTFFQFSRTGSRDIQGEIIKALTDAGIQVKLTKKGGPKKEMYRGKAEYRIVSSEYKLIGCDKHAIMHINVRDDFGGMVLIWLAKHSVAVAAA